MQGTMETKKEILKEKTGSGEMITEKTSAGPNLEQRTEAKEEKGVFQARYAVYYVVGFINILLAFRLVLKLLGANPVSGFVTFIYSVTTVFLAPFQGIFRTATTQGIETTAQLEPATVTAIVVYSIIGWGIAKLIDVLVTDKE
jgi:hypothetical protein